MRRKWSRKINLFKIVSLPTTKTTKNKFWECETQRGENNKKPSLYNN